MNWKIGDACYVRRGDEVSPAKVVKVGRKWMKVETQTHQEYEFDITQPGCPEKGPIYGYTPFLLTTEMFARKQALDRLEKLVPSALKFAKDVASKDHVNALADYIETWLHAG